MRKYLNLLSDIKSEGVYKAPARENMPGTTSLFGYQFRHNLQQGFPLLTTKELSFKNIVVELLWFLKGDTNIKYLVDNGCNIWNEDAYNYYCKICKKRNIVKDGLMLSYEDFVLAIKDGTPQKLKRFEKEGYIFGDCGKQYGWLWRTWCESHNIFDETGDFIESGREGIDQIEKLIEGLNSNPMSRRHIITAWNPATLDDMALNACHAFVQFNCRPIPWELKLKMAMNHPYVPMENTAITEAAAGNPNFGPVPQYYIDCHMYQRSADAFLGVPYNIASYALLTHILSKICNMVPGDYIHTFGDVHIYDNHKEQVTEQMSRPTKELPVFNIQTAFTPDTFKKQILEGELSYEFFTRRLNNYNPAPPIKGKLSTGLKK